MVRYELAVRILSSSIVVIGPLRSNTLSALSTDDENITDRKKKNERETNRRSHPVVGDEVYGEIMNCLGPS